MVSGRWSPRVRACRLKVERQREHSLREVFSALRFTVQAGAPWLWKPNDLRTVLRVGSDRTEEPSAAVLYSRTLRSTHENGALAGWDEYKRTRGSKLNSWGYLLALHVTPASEGDRTALAPWSWRERRSGLRGPRLHRREGRRRRGRAWHTPGTIQACGRQTRLRAAAQALGGSSKGSARDCDWKAAEGHGPLVRLAVTFSQARSRLRALSRNHHRYAPARSCYADAKTNLCVGAVP